MGGAAEGSVEMAAELTGELEQTREELQRRIPGIEDEEALSMYLRALDLVEAVLQEYWNSVREKVSTAEGSQATVEEAVVEEAVEQHGDSQLSQYAPNQEEEWPTVPPPAPKTTAEIESSSVADLLGLSSPRSVPNRVA